MQFLFIGQFHEQVKWRTTDVARHAAEQIGQARWWLDGFGRGGGEIHLNPVAGTRGGKHPAAGVKPGGLIHGQPLRFPQYMGAGERGMAA